MKSLILSIFLIIQFFLNNFSLQAVIKPETNPQIFKIDIKKGIGSTTWLYIKDGFQEASDAKADLILIHMNTYGGEVLYADSIRTKILNSKIPVYVFVDNNAASAGALISIACDRIYMRPGASIGAATVVNETGQQMPDKYQSYMRATMRATAESHGKDTLIQGSDTLISWKRDPLIAEAMVDSRTIVPGLIDSTKTLTFTAQEAMKYHYCEGICENVDELISKELKMKNYVLTIYSPGFWNNAKGFLMSSIVQGILIMIILGGIYFELQTPGLGFPSIAAVTAAILYFAPLYMDGLAQNWEIIVFVIGIALLAVEIFVIPGFGLTGILGVIFIMTGMVLSMLNNIDFDFTGVGSGELLRALFTVFAGIFAGMGLMIYLGSRIGAKGLLSKAALNTSLDLEAGYIGVPTEQLKYIGYKGVAYSDLRLSGKVKVDGKILDAVSEEGFIEKGTEIIISRYETGQVYVNKA